jgi:hypothetical protein
LCCRSAGRRFMLPARACGLRAVIDWVWNGSAFLTAPAQTAEQLLREEDPPSGETKAGDWGLCGLHPALVPDAATVVGWAHQQSLARVPTKVRV